MRRTLVLLVVALLGAGATFFIPASAQTVNCSRATTSGDVTTGSFATGTNQASSSAQDNSYNDCRQVVTNVDSPNNNIVTATTVVNRTRTRTVVVPGQDRVVERTVVVPGAERTVDRTVVVPGERVVERVAGLAAAGAVGAPAGSYVPATSGGRRLAATGSRTDGLLGVAGVAFVVGGLFLFAGQPGRRERSLI